MAPESVLTLQLYENASAKSMMGPPRQLDVDDIATNCDHAPFMATITDGPNWTKHPMAADVYNRCSPRISWPPEIKSLGAYVESLPTSKIYSDESVVNIGNIVGSPARNMVYSIHVGQLFLWKSQHVIF